MQYPRYYSAKYLLLDSLAILSSHLAHGVILFSNRLKSGGGMFSLVLIPIA